MKATKIYKIHALAWIFHFILSYMLSRSLK